MSKLRPFLLKHRLLLPKAEAFSVYAEASFVQTDASSYSKAFSAQVQTQMFTQTEAFYIQSEASVHYEAYSSQTQAFYQSNLRFLLPKQVFYLSRSCLLKPRPLSKPKLRFHLPNTEASSAQNRGLFHAILGQSPFHPIHIFYCQSFHKMLFCPQGLWDYSRCYVVY